MKAATRSSPYEITLVYVGLGEKDLSFAWLEKAFERRSSFALMTLNVEPRLDALRPDPRFADLVRRLGLSP